jgi:hypothetical protein
MSYNNRALQRQIDRRLRMEAKMPPRFWDVDNNAARPVSALVAERDELRKIVQSARRHQIFWMLVSTAAIIAFLIKH